MCLEGANDSCIHWLAVGCEVRGEHLHCNIFDFLCISFMAAEVVKKEQDLLTLLTHLAIKRFKPLLENVTCHPCH
jgi:hypothetical protein